MLLLAAILATGILALNPSTITNADAQMYGDQYGYDSDYYQDDNRYSYDNHPKKSYHTDIQKIKCVNSNIIVNGIDITKIPQDETATAAANEGGEGTNAANTENGKGLADRINFDRNLVNICVNVNDNEQVKVSAPEERTCETCFTSILTQEELDRLIAIVAQEEQLGSLQAICDFIGTNSQTPDGRETISNALFFYSGQAEISSEKLNAILDCLEEVYGVEFPPPDV
ncbi:MAG: hypothetical protein WCB31_00260 [Nitrososphaeraceae archaeon]